VPELGPNESDLRPSFQRFFPDGFAAQISVCGCRPYGRTARFRLDQHGLQHVLDAVHDVAVFDFETECAEPSTSIAPTVTPDQRDELREADLVEPAEEPEDCCV
jgi:hypothetical protein